ncbi:ABC transporter permease [Haloarcula sp. S1CR25-12]|uniref:ABC transporter permease n=1 Tax=Haloarcula saliterrae TaxID=2950534 RepID=A0ABU2FCT3_9EURY|nr:ABC transporter permease [Haloarcula sp. S1CR25-12]MDS0260072.1 ABC transporter permease [Haloarcula sp. S1CR25-12]
MSNQVEQSGSSTANETSLRALVRVTFEKESIILRRYWFNTVGGIGATYVMFLLIFFGGRTVTPTLVTENLTGIIVGFFIWTMSWSSFQTSAQTLSREARWGTLEQTYMSPFGLFTVISTRITVQLSYTLVIGHIMLLFMMIPTGTWVWIDPLSVVPLAVVTMLSATGLGYAFGGLALVYKRVSSIFMIVQVLLLGAISSPATLFTNLLPLAWGTDLIVVVISQGTSLWQLPLTDLGGVSAVTIGYLVVGYGVFGYAMKVTKRRGIMGHY